MATIQSCRTTDTNISVRVQDGMYVVDETINYTVITDVIETSPFVVAAASNLPEPYRSVSPSGIGICKTLEGTQRPDAPRVWDFVATFSSQVSEGNESTQNAQSSDPTTWVPIRETHLEPFTEVKYRALNGFPYVNGAGTPFESAPEIQRDLVRWEFFQFEPTSITDSQIAARNNSINKNSFLGYDKHTLLLRVVKSTIGFYYGRRLRLTHYNITYNPDNWHAKIANVGPEFVHNGKRYPYRYSEDGDVVVGPLGSKDYKYDEPYDAAAGEPSGGVTVLGNTVIAKHPPNPVLYFVERIIYTELDFSTFLRVI